MLFDDGALADQDTVYQLHYAYITMISLRSIHITQERFCKYLHRKGSDVCEAFHEDWTWLAWGLEAVKSHIGNMIMLARSGGAVNKVRPEDALVLMGFELLKKKKKKKRNEKPL